MQKTAGILKMINALKGVLSLDYIGAERCRNNMDTDGLIRHVSKIRDMLSDEIVWLNGIKEEMRMEKEYERFSKRKDPSYTSRQPKQLKWSEIPELARKEIMDNYCKEVKDLETVDIKTHDEVMSKIFEDFKRKYNIDKIII